MNDLFPYQKKILDAINKIKKRNDETMMIILKSREQLGNRKRN